MFRAKGTLRFPPAPVSVFDGVLKPGGNVVGMVAGIAYPDEITTIGESWKSLRIAPATPVRAKWKVSAGRHTALPTNLCGMSLPEGPLSSDGFKGSVTVIKPGAKVPNCWV